MAKRMTSTGIWQKEWFMTLEPRLKCLVRFIWDNCDNAGVWSPNWRLASLMIGADVSIRDIEKIDNGNRHFIMPNGKIFIKEFIEFQCGSELKETSYPHKKVIRLLKEHGLYSRVVSRVVNGVHSTLKEEEEYIEEEEEEEKEEKEGEIEKKTHTLNIHPTFDEFWKAYDKKVGKKKTLAKWKKLKQSDREEIMLHVPAYVLSTPDDNYRKNPLTYLNGEHWNDEIIKAKSNGKKTDSDWQTTAYKIAKKRGLVQ